MNMQPILRYVPNFRGRWKNVDPDHHWKIYCQHYAVQQQWLNTLNCNHEASQFQHSVWLPSNLQLLDIPKICTKSLFSHLLLGLGSIHHTIILSFSSWVGFRVFFGITKLQKTDAQPKYSVHSKQCRQSYYTAKYFHLCQMYRHGMLTTHATTIQLPLWPFMHQVVWNSQTSPIHY